MRDSIQASAPCATTRPLNSSPRRIGHCFVAAPPDERLRENRPPRLPFCPLPVPASREESTNPLRDELRPTNCGSREAADRLAGMTATVVRLGLPSNAGRREQLAQPIPRLPRVDSARIDLRIPGPTMYIPLAPGRTHRMPPELAGEASGTSGRAYSCCSGSVHSSTSLTRPVRTNNSNSRAMPVAPKAEICEANRISRASPARPLSRARIARSSTRSPFDSASNSRLPVGNGRGKLIQVSFCLDGRPFAPFPCVRPPPTCGHPPGMLVDDVGSGRGTPCRHRGRLEIEMD